MYEINCSYECIVCGTTESSIYRVNSPKKEVTTHYYLDLIKHRAGPGGKKQPIDAGQTPIPKPSQKNSGHLFSAQTRPSGHILVPKPSLFRAGLTGRAAHDQFYYYLIPNNKENNMDLN